ncbi:hypothetical protein J5N97_013929 [Dioscorea zingiberensis]|uniref:Pectinesterase inhibitor domain-containing protein n=1 Tax=Dioscorea zingiberensis TaxID=325984 RepID=A0A9D5CRG0_9LILI|nr:hypothetical protein J5N97_013929 [Dioscorea zingiberensis]
MLQLLAALAGADLVQDTCKQSGDLKDLCVQALTSDPKSEGSDEHGLARVALGLTARDAAGAADELMKMAEHTSAHEEELLQCLEDCNEEYEDAVQQLEQSRVSMDEREYHEVVMFVEAAMSDVKSCEDACRDVKEVVHQKEKDVISEKNEHVKEMCGITLSLTKGLQHGGITNAPH